VTKYEKKYLSIDDKRIEMLGWVRKHRRKFAYGGAIVGGLYVAGRLAAWHVQRTRNLWWCQGLVVRFNVMLSLIS